MSVTAQSHVWKYSRAKGSALLVLLAIADYAHDDGQHAWPNLDALAEKTRMTERSMRSILADLVEMGELRIRKNIERLEVKGGYIPRRFMDVLCVRQSPRRTTGKDCRRGTGKDCRSSENSDQFAPENEGNFEAPEKISGCDLEEISTGQSANFAASEKQDTGKILQRNRKNPAPPPTPPYKEDPSVDPLEEQTRDADASLVALNASEGDQRTILKARFDRIVAIHPRADKLKRAFKLFQKLNPTETLTDFIIADIERKKRSVWGGVEPRFIPGLHRYLEDERWTDDVSDIAPYSNAELAAARKVMGRRYLGRCPHTPACESIDDCLKTIAGKLRGEHRRSA